MDEKKLGPFPISADTASVLSDLQARVRGAGHRKPSQATLVSALIHAAPKDGRQLELKVLAPYRKAHPEVDT